MKIVNEVWAKMGRHPIPVRPNKGEDTTSNIKSRLVAREIRTAGQDAITAPTLPFKSLRMVLSMATTKFEGADAKRQPLWDPESVQRTQVTLIDIRRAYFNAKTDDDVPIYV